MVDIELLANALRAYGHNVSSYFKVPTNAGGYELVVDGETLTIEEARALLTTDEAAGPPKQPTL